MKRLQDKVCVITGTASGMGRAAALLFAQEGAKVIGCDINTEGATKTVAMVRSAGGEMMSLQPCDMTRREQAEALMEFAISHYGQINVLYNNGAMAYFDWIAEMEDDAWDDTISQELDIVYRGVKAVWPYMTGNGGAIINTASVCGRIALREVPALAHCAAKGGVIAMTKQIAMEGGPLGIRANTISPGLIVTAQTKPMLESSETYKQAMQEKIMLGRFGQPEDVAQCALYLASDESAWVTGADFAVDGGATAW